MVQCRVQDVDGFASSNWEMQHSSHDELLTNHITVAKNLDHLPCARCDKLQGNRSTAHCTLYSALHLLGAFQALKGGRHPWFFSIKSSLNQVQDTQPRAHRRIQASHKAVQGFTGGPDADDAGRHVNDENMEKTMSVPGVILCG